MESATKLDSTTEAALRSLRDIAVPEPVSWVPQTWGWAVLAAAMAVMLLLLCLRWTLQYRGNAYRREALLLLSAIDGRLRHPASRQEGVRELGELLKRTALAAWPRDEVASLSTADWVRFLDAHDDGQAGHALERLLDDFEYHGEKIVADLPSEVCDDLLVATRNWIERHHVPA